MEASTAMEPVYTDLQFNDNRYLSVYYIYFFPILCVCKNVYKFGVNPSFVIALKKCLFTYTFS